MATVATTKLSSKGQVVIPEQIRRQLGLETGTQFVAVADGDLVVLRVIRPPTVEHYAELAQRAEHEAGRIVPSLPPPLPHQRREPPQSA